jgi:hypothetical protein
VLDAATADSEVAQLRARLLSCRMVGCCPRAAPAAAAAAVGVGCHLGC